MSHRKMIYCHNSLALVIKRVLQEGILFWQLFRQNM